MSTGPLQSSIKSVSSLASSAKTTAGGLKSNNGIENSKSAIEGKERSEAILESMFAFGIEHAQEFAQRELDDDLRWWKRMGDRTMVENMSAQKGAAGAQVAAGIGAAGLAGIGGGIAALASKKDSNESNGQDIKENQKSNNVQKLTQNDPKDKDKIQEINQEGQTQSQQHNLVAQSETDTWQSQDSKVMDATDPDTIFT
jgi:hypothetical protein